MEPKEIPVRIILAACLTIAVAIAAHANVMSSIWPQKALLVSQHGPVSASVRVFVAGTTSPFRDQITARLVDSLVADSVYVHVAPVKELMEQDLSSWHAVVLLNTCIAWDIENRTRKAIKANPGYRGFVLLTTSGDPDSCCARSKLPAGVDAVSSPSQESRLQPTVDRLLAAIRTITGHQRPLQGAPTDSAADSTVDGATSATYKKK